MGGTESTEKILNELNLTQEFCNKVVDIQETNTTYQTKSTTTINNTINNMMETIQNSTTESNNSVDTSIVVDINMTNNTENNDITLDGATNVSFKQINNMTTSLNNYNNFNHKVWNESNILMNVDADIMQKMMDQMSITNQTTASQATEDQLQNAVSQINQMVASMDTSNTNESEGEFNNFIDKLSGCLNTLINGICGNTSNKETSNIQDIKTSIKNELERRNITNVDQIAECVVNTAFVFNNNNTVQNYCNTISTYTSHLSFLVSAKMTNNFNGNTIRITGGDNITFDQSNFAKQQLINTMLTSITTDNYFGNSTAVEVKSQTETENYIENMNTTSTDQKSSTDISNDVSNIQDQTASIKEEETNKSTSLVSAAVMGVICIVVFFVAIFGIIGKVFKGGSQQQTTQATDSQRLLEEQSKTDPAVDDLKNTAVNAAKDITKTAAKKTVSVIKKIPL